MQYNIFLDGLIFIFSSCLVTSFLNLFKLSTLTLTVWDWLLYYYILLESKSSHLEFAPSIIVGK